MMKKNGRPFHLFGGILLIFLGLVALVLSGCAATSVERKPLEAEARPAESPATIPGDKDKPPHVDTAGTKAGRETHPPPNPSTSLRAGLPLEGGGVVAKPEATSPPDKSPQGAAALETTSLQDRWGIGIVSLRLTAAGLMLDFRYRVIDPDKAGPILDFKIKPYLIDQKTGAKLAVPSMPKVGTLRQTSRSGPPQAGRTYFTIFANPGRSVQPGERVTVVIGDFKAENLVVE